VYLSALRSAGMSTRGSFGAQHVAQWMLYDSARLSHMANMCYMGRCVDVMLRWVRLAKQSQVCSLEVTGVNNLSRTKCAKIRNHGDLSMYLNTARWSSRSPKFGALFESDSEAENLALHMWHAATDRRRCPGRTWDDLGSWNLPMDSAAIADLMYSMRSSPG
jgi:hypothetical protein